MENDLEGRPGPDSVCESEFVRPAEGARMLGISRAKFYVLMANGDFGTVVKLGRCTLVQTPLVRAWAMAKIREAETKQTMIHRVNDQKTSPVATSPTTK